MKNIHQYLAVILFSVSAGYGHAAEQQVLFCSNQFTYNSYIREEKCRDMCSAYDSPNCLQDQLSRGWEVVASSSKNRLQSEPSRGTIGACSCVGTEYVLKKEEKQVVVAPSPMTSEKIALLEKEIELLKKENSMLQKELDDAKGKVSKKR